VVYKAQSAVTGGVDMRRLTRQSIKELVPYPPGKPIEELERELGISGTIKLASNENPIGPSPLAVKAILEHVDSLNRYPDGSCYYLKERLSGILGLAQSRIIVGNGSNELIELAIRTFLEPGNEVIQAFPTFLVYQKIVSGAGGRMVSIPLSELKIDLGAVLGAVTSSTKIIIINNPNNPTGTALGMDEMRTFLKGVPEDVVVVLDEAYIEFASDDSIADGLLLADSHPLLITMRTFSKLYGLAGLRIGYGFASEEVVDYMNRVRQPFNANSLAQAAATAALDDKEFVSRTLALVRDGLAYLYQELDTIGLPYVPSQTNFFLIKVPMGADRLYNRMLREGVIIRSMASFGLPDYIRINVGLPEENERFLRTLRDAMEEYETTG
jgi:histidinol-phosphate aminotransferase